jgi:hypothetical protein
MYSLPLNRLVHENLSILMNFCFSWKPLQELVRTHFVGEWKYLNRALFEVSEQRALKAALELAVFMRLLDDREDITGYFNQTNQTKNWNFGRLIFENKPEQILKMRDVANKIIHASELKWDFFNSKKPILICIPQDKDKWIRAEVDIVTLAGFCGGIGS